MTPAVFGASDRTGTSGDDSFEGNVSQVDYLYEFSNYSQYTYTEFDEATGDTNYIYPYDDAKFDARVVFSKEGDDTFDLTDKDIDTDYIVPNFI